MRPARPRRERTAWLVRPGRRRMIALRCAPVSIVTQIDLKIALAHQRVDAARTLGRPFSCPRLWHNEARACYRNWRARRDSGRLMRKCSFPCAATSPVIMAGSAWPHFVLRYLPPSPARVLEIGCGPVGDSTYAIAAAGYDIVAVDPVAPEGPLFRRIPFEDFTEPGPFDAVVASLSMHHIADLTRTADGDR